MTYTNGREANKEAVRISEAQRTWAYVRKPDFRAERYEVIIGRENAQPGDSYGDIFVDTKKSMEIYREWLKMTRPAPGPDGLRRPLWMKRALRPVEEVFYLK